MLMLRRKVGESIVLPGLGITIAVMAIESRGDGQVMIGIDAPPDVVVHRWEIAERIRREAVERGA